MKMIDSFILLSVLLGALLVGPLAALALAPPALPNALALVVSASAEEMVLSAGGQIVGPISSPFAVFATGDSTFLASLERAGAWAVLDGGWISTICGPESTYS